MEEGTMGEMGGGVRERMAAKMEKGERGDLN